MALKPIVKNIFLLFIPFGVYLFYTSFLKTWIVDDAGISFAYARNLAHGYGLTSWPGEKPVEGFSNFLWTLLMAGFHVLKVFDPIVTPKIVASLFMLGSFYILHAVFLKITKAHWLGLFVNVLIASNAPIVIWTQSGLENALYLFLLLLLAYHVFLFADGQTMKKILLLSFITFLIAITRPDGCLYFFVFPAVVLLSRSPSRKRTTTVTYYTLFFLLAFGCFLTFRFVYFHELVPNTYYAKYQSIYTQSNFIDKLEYLSFSIGGRWGKYLILLNLLALPFIWIAAKANFRILKTWFILFLFGFANFLLLPNDWMGELRFASPFIIFFYGWFSYQFYIFYQHFCKRSNFKKWISIASLCLFLLYSGYHFQLRVIAFSKDPTVPFTEIKTLYADKFNRYAQQLNLMHASILLPDVGASLYYSDYKIYDAVGLCDKTIAQNLGKDNTALLDYVFEQIKPTFIHLHLRWADMYALDEDGRFTKDYIPLPNMQSLRDPAFPANGSGDFIRRDAINQQNQAAFDHLFVLPIQ